jgi:hypothetical protein
MGTPNIKYMTGHFPDLAQAFKKKWFGILRAKTGWLGIRLIYLSGSTCLPANYCFSEMTLYNSNKAC